MSFPPGTEMFQFPGFASKPLWIQDLDTFTDHPSGNPTVSHAVTRQEVEGGFPHSEILGSKPVRGSPRLIAAYHVLHRLSAPRHPPNALMALDRSHDRCPLPRPRACCDGHRQKDLATPQDRSQDVLPACRAIRGALAPRAGAPVMPTSSRCHIPACQALEGPERHAKLFAPSIRMTGSTPPHRRVVEPDGIEPTTSCLQSTRSPN